MGRSKVTQRRRREEKLQQEDQTEKVSKPDIKMATTEALFRSGEVLTRGEIEERIERSKLVRRADDEYFRLVKSRFFKRYEGKLIVRK